MITDVRIETYIESLSVPLPPFLEQLERQAHAQGIPIIRKSARDLIKYALESKQPRRMLEIGTATGFSAIFAATFGPEDLHIDTIENYAKRIEEAKKNISVSGMDGKITLIEGDALEVLEDLAAKGRVYDMIFMDAAKAQYINYLPLCRKMMTDGSILISDNILFDGDIILSRFAVRRRDRTIHARMREFLRDLSADDGLVTTILPIGDGMTMSVMKQNRKQRGIQGDHEQA